jgi:O-acetylhomoserine/O-acetylserine sulfhydrylase-like pyridoxal-dependent enzyme
MGPERRGRGFGTRAVHGVAAPLPAERPLAAPIWQTSTFAFDDAEHYAHTLHQPRQGFVYTRYENPTTAALEATVADLEGAAEGLATASGMGAIATVLLSLASSGDHLVAQRDLYGGTFSLLTGIARRFGIDVDLVDGTDPAAVRAALRPRTRAVYAETIANPTMTVADLPRPGCRWSSTTPSPRRTCAGRSSTAPRSWSTRPPSTWAATATWSAGWPCSPSRSGTPRPGGP